MKIVLLWLFKLYEESTIYLILINFFMIKALGLMLMLVWGMSHSIEFMHTVKPKEEFCMY